MFDTLHTGRLLIRQFQESDAVALAERRSHPDVARYQNWEYPFPVEKARGMVSELLAMDGPENDEWWMALVCDADTGVTLGDLAVHLSWGGRSAEVGYNFSPEHWGRGYASESLGRLIEFLFDDVGVTRVFGGLHPDNKASAMVLERNGFLFEGHTRSSYWDGDECSDDWIYGLLRGDWEEWRSRKRVVPESVKLIGLDIDNEREVSRLKTHKTQEQFVAPMQWSYADALFPEVVDGAPVVPKMWGVEADGEYVGFVMIAARTEAHPEPYLWRLLIDRLHQRRGIGSQALDLLAAECREMGDAAIMTSWVEGRGSPREFYENHGFEPTGRIIDGETEARWRFG